MVGLYRRESAVYISRLARLADVYGGSYMVYFECLETYFYEYFERICLYKYGLRSEEFFERREECEEGIKSHKEVLDYLSKFF